MRAAPTVFDVIENHLGDRPTRAQLEALSIEELEELAGYLGELSTAQADEEIPGGASLLGGWLSSFWSERVLREELSDSILYYDRLLVMDPLADYFSDRSALPQPHPIRYRRPDGGENTITAGAALWNWGSYEEVRSVPADAARRFAAIVMNLYELEQPIRSGVLVLRNQWPVLAERAEQLATAVRHDVGSKELQTFVRGVPPTEVGLTAWDSLQGGGITFDSPARAADKPWQAEPFFYYLNKMLAVADAAGAQYIPSTALDLGLLERKVSGALHRMHPGVMLREVSRVAVPSVEVPIREAVAMRRSSEDFEDWRSTLSAIQRNGSADTSEELAQRVEDELAPRVRAVQRGLQRSSFAASVRSQGASLVIDGAIGAATAMLTHDVWGAGAGVTSGALHWIYRAYTREKPHGADAVLSVLVKAGNSKGVPSAPSHRS